MPPPRTAWGGGPARRCAAAGHAAAALSLSDTTVSSDGQSGVSYDPPYCYYEGSVVKFNEGANTGSCTGTDRCVCRGYAPPTPPSAPPEAPLPADAICAEGCNYARDGDYDDANETVVFYGNTAGLPTLSLPLSIATWMCEPDLAEPFGVLDLADVQAFVSAFVGNQPLADLNSDGVWDLADVQSFVSWFNSGCP